MHDFNSCVKDRFWTQIGRRLATRFGEFLRLQERPCREGLQGMPLVRRSERQHGLDASTVSDVNEKHLLVDVISVTGTPFRPKYST